LIGRNARHGLWFIEPLGDILSPLNENANKTTPIMLMSFLFVATPLGIVVKCLVFFFIAYVLGYSCQAIYRDYKKQEKRF
jgi:hypothetical protein